MKPERCVGFVRADDEAHRSRQVELVDQPTHHPRQRDAVHEQNPLVALLDERLVVHNRDGHRNEVLQME